MHVSAHDPTAGSLEATKSPTCSRAKLHGSLRALRAAIASRETRGALLRVAGRRLGNPADAEDCVQEACVVAFLHVDQLREPERVRAWLTSIVVNASRMRVRADHGQRRVRATPVDVRELRGLSDPSPSIDERLSVRQAVVRIRASALRHDERDLRVIDALVDDDADYDVLARRCAMSRSAFKTRVSRLRKRLKKAGYDRAA